MSVATSIDLMLEGLMNMDVVGGLTNEEFEQKLRNAKTLINVIDDKQREKAADITLYCAVFMHTKEILTEKDIDQFSDKAFKSLKELQSLSHKKRKLKQFMADLKERGSDQR